MHYNDAMMGTMASQITSLTIVYSAIYSGADQRNHQSSASLSFVWGIHRGPVNSPHKGPVTRKMFPFDDVIMTVQLESCSHQGPFTIWIMAVEIILHLVQVLVSFAAYEITQYFSLP